MPKIEVVKDALFRYIGSRVREEDFIRLLSSAKAELDGEEDGVLKIELNDTNRPDLWSTAGLGRHLNIYTGGGKKEYGFFSSPGNAKDCGDRIIEVDPELEKTRPFMTAFAVKGKGIEEELLRDIIQTQEKLCWNYGQKRKTIAMGVYRSDLFSYPVKYRASDPDNEKFIPLGFDRELSLKNILREHPKGQEFGHIISRFEKYPHITDVNGKTLSMPPIINSNDIGAVVPGDSELFVEMTGTEIYSLLHASSIVACDLSDAGYEILPVKTVYPYDTPLGREVTSPFYFQDPVSAGIEDINRLLGEDYTVEEAAGYAGKLGCRTETSENSIVLYPAEYRNDFLHSVDVIEDIMIGKGLHNFEQIMPDDYTVGRLSPATGFGRKVKQIMIGLGFQEMIYNYLGSGRDYIQNMNMDGREVVRIANPMSESFEYLRPSVLPSLLSSEAASGNAVYPHKIFETGKTAVKDESENYGVRTINSLGFMTADREAGFNIVSSQLSAVMFYLSEDYVLEETGDPRFIPGRCAKIMVRGRETGVMGEISPAVLSRWGVQMPCACCEINLDLIMKQEGKNRLNG